LGPGKLLPGPFLLNLLLKRGIRIAKMLDEIRVWWYSRKAVFYADIDINRVF
jgi:hypothetical protein